MNKYTTLILLTAAILLIIAARGLLASRMYVPHTFELFDTLTVSGSIFIIAKSRRRLRRPDCSIAILLGIMIGAGMCFATLFSPYPFLGIVKTNSGQAAIRGAFTASAALGGLAVMRMGEPVAFHMAKGDWQRAGRSALQGLGVGLPLAGLNVVVLLIYGDFCPLSPQQRAQLLNNVRRALKVSGFFVLDVTTRHHRQKFGNCNNWYAVESGFWKPGPHLVLEEGFDYPEESIYLDQAIVIEDTGKISVYRNWFQDYTLETITAELATGGFAVKSAWSDLTGTHNTEDTEWIVLVTQKFE
jgi:hypothetical protein